MRKIIFFSFILFCGCKNDNNVQSSFLEVANRLKNSRLSERYAPIRYDGTENEKKNIEILSKYLKFCENSSKYVLENDDVDFDKLKDSIIKETFKSYFKYYTLNLNVFRSEKWTIEYDKINYSVLLNQKINCKTDLLVLLFILEQLSINVVFHSMHYYVLLDIFPPNFQKKVLIHSYESSI